MTAMHPHPATGEGSGTAAALTGNRLDAAFSRARQEGRAALIVYITVGHPDLETTRRLVPALFAAGADVLELGMPFSDPLADGPTIQRSTQQALRQGVRLRDVLGLVRELRDGGLDRPLVLLSYANPLLVNGLLDDPSPLARAGFDGVIVPDLPSVESEEVGAAFAAAGVHLIPFVAPTSPDEHVRRVASGQGGFVYCVSVTGVTGARHRLPAGVVELLRRVRAAGPRPVAIGFGVSGPEQARELAAHADGIIVGSALVERIDRAAGNPQDAGAGAGPEGDGRASAVVAAAAEFVASLRQAIDPGGRQPAQLLRPSP